MKYCAILYYEWSLFFGHTKFHAIFIIFHPLWTIKCFPMYKILMEFSFHGGTFSVFIFISFTWPYLETENLKQFSPKFSLSWNWMMIQQKLRTALTYHPRICKNFVINFCVRLWACSLSQYLSRGHFKSLDCKSYKVSPELNEKTEITASSRNP